MTASYHVAFFLTNAAHVKNCRRRIDVNDARSLAELLAHGLLRAAGELCAGSADPSDEYLSVFRSFATPLAAT